MSGIFPNSVDGGIEPAAATNGLVATVQPIGTEDLYFGGQCNIKLRPHVLNALISEILCVLNDANIAYDSSSVCNLKNAISTINSRKNYAVYTVAYCQTTAPVGAANDYWMNNGALSVFSGGNWVSVAPATGPNIVVCNNCTTLQFYMNCGTAYVLQDNAAAAGNSVGTVPVGGSVDYFGVVAPTNWHFMDGSELARAAYPTLFSNIGVIYGSGDGSTTFNLPDLRGRTTFGRDDMGGALAGRINGLLTGINGALLGGNGGNDNLTLQEENMPVPDAQTVTITGLGNQFGPLTLGNNSGGLGAAVMNNNVGISLFPDLGAGAASGTVNSPYNTAVAAPINNMPPTLIVNKIIRIA